mgnify:CR=1 FL=1
MIQDIAPHTYHNEYKPVAPDKESHILAYEEGKILMKKDGETMTLPSFGELEGKVENLYCFQLLTRLLFGRKET